MFPIENAFMNMQTRFNILGGRYEGFLSESFIILVQGMRGKA